MPGPIDPRLPYPQAVAQGVATRMVGLDRIIQQCLTAYFCGGHVLLEGNPGTGKTTLVKELTRWLGFPTGTGTRRIQFTPDLMPSDITGAALPEGGDFSRFTFRPGPIFTRLLLADEINRATPKTQAALLEAMAEGTVTVLGQTHRINRAVAVRDEHGTRLALRPPFMVLATQNPIEHEGTFTLPEAQLDRFMFKLVMPDLSAAALARVIDQETGLDLLQAEAEAAHGELTGDEGAAAATAGAAAAHAPFTEADALLAYAQQRRRVFGNRMADGHPVREHVLNMILASAGRVAEMNGGRGLAAGPAEWLARMRDSLIRLPLGPRFARDAMLAAQAWPVLFTNDPGRDSYAAGLAEMALPVLRHRLHLDFDWPARAPALVAEAGAVLGRRVTPPLEAAAASGDIHRRLDALLGTLWLMVAPADRDYRLAFAGHLLEG